MSLIWAESTVKQYMRWIQGIQVQKALNLVGNWWYRLSNLTWVTKLRLGVSLVILRDPSAYTLIKLERLIHHLQMMVKHEYVEYARKKSITQVKVKARCSKYDHHLCGKHMFVICQTYFENKKNNHINTVSAYFFWV